MPVLIDGNNLLFAARELENPDQPPGRARLCAVLGRWAERRAERVHVVFDGPPPSGGLAEQIGHSALIVSYSGRRTADAVLMQLLETDSAARRLTVVSSDRAVAKAAKRRRAKPVRSQVFWAAVQRDLARPEREPLEPPEKTEGLPPGDEDEWLRELGLDDQT